MKDRDDDAEPEPKPEHEEENGTNGESHKGERHNTPSNIVDQTH